LALSLPGHHLATIFLALAASKGENVWTVGLVGTSLFRMSITNNTKHAFFRHCISLFDSNISIHKPQRHRKLMKTYHIHLEDFEADVAVSMSFDTSTVEDAILAGIVEQIAQQIEPEKPEN
jgi:hypothetical protein